MFLLCFFAACKSADKKTEGLSENNIDAARNFVRAALDGKFEDARAFMLPDSVNNNYMDVAERSFNNAAQSVKDSFRTSTIVVHNVKDLNDSTTVITFSNSYKKEKNDLKVVRIHDQWLIDLKYLYEHRADSAGEAPLLNDTLK